MFNRLGKRLRYCTWRGTLLDWERAGFPGWFILATGSHHQVYIQQPEPGAGFLITHDLLGEVAHQPEPTFDAVCRWSMTRFAGVQYGWWQVRRFGRRSAQQGRRGGVAPHQR